MGWAVTIFNLTGPSIASTIAHLSDRLASDHAQIPISRHKQSDWVERTKRTQWETSHDPDDTTALCRAFGVFGVNGDLPTVSGRCSIP
jgi:Na+-translocating ferredoxin:NAD+ oxidoreductase RnfC subunit